METKARMKVENASQSKASRVHNTYLETLYRLSAVSFGIVAAESLLPLHVLRFVVCFLAGFLFCVIAEREAFRGRVVRNEFYRCLIGDTIDLVSIGLLEFAFLRGLSEDWSACTPYVLSLLTMGALRWALSRYHKTPIRGGVVEVAAAAAFANGLFDLATEYGKAHSAGVLGAFLALYAFWMLAELLRHATSWKALLDAVNADFVTTWFNGFFVLALSSLVALRWEKALVFGIALTVVGALLKFLVVFTPESEDRMAHIG